MKNTNLTPPTASQAYIYIRLSSQSQAWGDGERRQHDAAMRFVETHNLPVAETLQDIGVSAFRGDNALTGELGRFLQRCESGEVPPGSVLVAESLDRLTRNRVNEALLLLLNITQRGVKIGLTAQNVILDLASYAAFFPILADMMRSNSESEHKSFRSLANWQTKRKLAKTGVIVTSQVPRWLEARDGKIHVLEERAQLVRRIFDMYVSGYGRGVIARTLIKEGIPAWNTRKPVWHESYVNKLLCNRAVVGEYIAEFKTEEGVMGQEVIVGYYPEVIDRATFDRVQDMAFLRKKGQRGRKGKKFANLFQKLARCSVCGGTMGYHNATVDKTRKNGVRPWAHYLTCNSAHAGHGCANRRYFNYLYLENFVLSGTMDDLDIVAAVGIHSTALKQHTDRIAALEAQLENADARIQKHVALLVDNDLAELEELGQQLAELKRKRVALRAQLMKARAEATAARQAAEDSTQFRGRSDADVLSSDTGLPGYVDMSDEAVYARRARIAMQLRSVVESVTCSPDKGVKIVMKSGTTYELVEKEWICTKQGPLTPAGKSAVARFFVGRATWQLGQVEESDPDGREDGAGGCSEHSCGAAKGKRPPKATSQRPRSVATPEPHELCRKVPSLLGRSRVHPMLKEWAQEHMVGADTLARPAHAVLPDDNVECGAGLERQRLTSGVLVDEPQDMLLRERDVLAPGEHGFHPRRGSMCFFVRSGGQPIGPGGGVPAHEALGQGVGVGGGKDHPGGTRERKDRAG
ncbi:MAG: recombinase family protein [Humidesulfovibrio sp.]|uniref:recombinase family protein n=1 Tax=Humidesulfovibrio sp. TaxID=2910988 RepID=UPI0027E624CB|nr:recombinase family protein [Humidesulfovibrio sp.]MDQ7836266.1 recombinase family protein [Humidesulfovibrio sp.]